MAEQLRFHASDDPSKRRLRPCSLQRAHDRQHVAGVADRRETQNTNAARSGIEGGSHALGLGSGLWAAGQNGRVYCRASSSQERARKPKVVLLVVRAEECAIIIR